MNTRLLTGILTIIFFCGTICSGQIYQRIRIEAPTHEQLALLANYDDDHARVFRNGSMETILDSSAVGNLRAAGCTVTVLIPDLARYYRDRAAADIQSMKKASPQLLEKPSANLSNFALGSVGGFLSLSELSSQYGAMLDKYPNLVAAPEVIGKTVQGLSIYAIRISARPESDKTVPQVLYTGMHHAREPGSMMSLLYTMWWLLENYGTDPQATYLLNNRALYFIPVVNPDGYARNIREYPSGGGMWRKNMRDNGENGVDINRNYGPQEYWDNPAGGSSDDPRSDSYRGPGPFSEPETQAMRNFCNGHQFLIAVNRHTYSDLLVMPFDWKSRFPQDSVYYRTVSRELARVTGYASGSALETVGYSVRGDADSWMYSYGSKGEKMIAWTPEAGCEEDGFWPRPSRITPMAELDNDQNLLAAWLAGAAPRITSVQRINDGSGNPLVRLVITNLGRRSMSSGSVVKLDIDGAIEGTIPALAPLQSVTIDLPIPLSIAKLKPARPELRVMIRYENVPITRTISLVVHPVTTRITENFEKGLAGWDKGSWEIEPVLGRGNVLSDSPLKNYSENPTPKVAQWMTMIPLHATELSSAELSFDANYVVQGRDHFAAVQVQKVGSGTWEDLECEDFQIPNDSDLPLRTRLRGNAGQWKRYNINLDKYLGSDIYLRFYFLADRSQFGYTFNGVLIDSLKITTSTAPLNDVPLEQSGMAQQHMSVYPNPFASQVTVHVDGGNSRTTVRLVDMLGRVVASGTGTDLVFETPTLPGGCYSVIAVTGTTISNQRIILHR